MEYKIREYDDNIYPMGLTRIENGIHISVSAVAKTCELLLYKTGREKPCKVIAFPSENCMGDVWEMTLEGDFSELEYCFRIDGETMPDPYGTSFSGRERWGNVDQLQNQIKTPVMPKLFDWQGDKPLMIPYENSIIYRLHVRGFTKHVSSGVKNKGTFMGIIEKIPYLKELGITAIEMMPPVEFDEIIMRSDANRNPYRQQQMPDEPTGKINYWGYTKAKYFAPKTSYTSGKEKDPVNEFKKLVRELHKAGIEVIIEMFFSEKEEPTMILNAVRYWVREYHIDGVHLVGQAPPAYIGSDPYLSKTKLFATCWDGISGGSHKHLAEYNDGFLVDMRRLLKGDEDQMRNLIFRTKKNPKDKAVINYIANSNGFTLMDMVSYDIKHNEANGENNRDGNDYNFSWNCGTEGQTRKRKIMELRKKQLRNAILFVFLSQGTPLFMAGDEFCNSKHGNNNSYCQDNEISWLNWNLIKKNSDILEFFKHVIAFRKTHGVFHMPEEPKVMDYISCGHPDLSFHGVRAWCPEFENFRRQLGMMYCGEYAKKNEEEKDNYFYVVYNMHWEAHEFALPNLPRGNEWRICFDTNNSEANGYYSEGDEKELEDQKKVLVSPRTTMVFISHKLPVKKPPRPVRKKTEMPR